MTEIVKMRGEGLATVGRWGGQREDGEWWHIHVAIHERRQKDCSPRLETIFACMQEHL